MIFLLIVSGILFVVVGLIGSNSESVDPEDRYWFNAGIVLGALAMFAGFAMWGLTA